MSSVIVVLMYILCVCDLVIDEYYSVVFCFSPDLNVVMKNGKRGNRHNGFTDHEMIFKMYGARNAD